MAELAAPLVPKATRHTADADAAPGEYVERLHGRRCVCAPSCLSAALAVAGIPVACAPLCGACVVVHPREAAVVQFFGEYHGTLAAPGLYCVNPCGRELQIVSTQTVALELDAVKVADGNGNPLILSGVVTFVVADPAKAALNVAAVKPFVTKQSHAVLKRIASRFPYEAPDGGPSLKTEAVTLSGEMVAELQDRCAVAGVQIVRFDLADISYAPEIAPAMLVRQQALALVDARHTIVAGAVQIVAGAVEGLAKVGLSLSGAERSRVVNNLLTVISGHTAVQPVIPLQAVSDDT